MAYEAMARRYRPRTFDDVVGQEHVAQTLKNAILTERVAHAYLFCGPHGCGKTSMARIFACSLVCQNGPTAEPCGKCDICNDVLRGQDMDVQEIDGASNNGVEQVRVLREQAGYIPTRARFKVYIIDEVHMLSTAAFNALLKTLEEPPAHVKFILATTDPHKILGTILSRCQRFDFRLVPPPKMSAFFSKLIAQENAEITSEALDAVAAFSGGSVRDGLVLLDQLVSYSQGKVTREDVERVRGVAGAEAVAGIYEAILSRKVADALKIVDEVASKGTNTGDFLDQLIEYGRDVMMVIATGTAEGVTAYGPARSILLDIANSISLDQALLMLDVFAQARTRVRSRALSNTLVPLEMAVARLAGLDSLAPVSDILRTVDAYARGAPLPEPVHAAGAKIITNNPPATQVTAVVETQRESYAQTPQTMRNVHDSGSAKHENYQSSGAESVDLSAAENLVSAAHPSEDAPQPPVKTPPWEEVAQREVIADDTPAQDFYSEDTVSDNDLSPESSSGGDDDFTAPVTAATEQYYDNATGADNAATATVVEPVTDRATREPLAAPAPEVAVSIEKIWQEIKGLLAQSSPADNSLLADVYIDRIEPEAVYLSVPGGGSFIFEQLEDKHRKARLAGCASEVLKRNVCVHLTLRDAITPVAQRTEPRRSASARAREQAEHDPGVRLIVSTFNAEIKNIEEKR